ncbi:Hypothetical protein I595_1685 [Croceitalea dokdonensis DOKDO 023]|uniref:Uncharacterized protein n=2 Tax=Croceitalea TaxID=574891 RepID=A0A0P7A5X5_9FLAO|nr:Hypothetical protein I595_1685 [Croceitalea dokdonensis DOKDO 023]
MKDKPFRYLYAFGGGMKKGNWFWNLVILLTVVVCVAAFVLHYKNWAKLEEGNFGITSGIYRKTIPINDISVVAWVDKIPQMERKNGFSWGVKEKGIFMDSITAKEVFVFVDNLRTRKVLLSSKDSIDLYFNFTDSTETQRMYQKIKALLTQQQTVKP